MESQPFFMRTPQMYIKNNLFNDIPFVITCASYMRVGVKSHLCVSAMIELKICRMVGQHRYHNFESICPQKDISDVQLN
jgi:hypothetical protein